MQFKCLVVVHLPNVKSSPSYSLLLLTFVKAFPLEILKSIYIDSDPTFQAESNDDRLSVSLAHQLLLSSIIQVLSVAGPQATTLWN